MLGSNTHKSSKLSPSPSTPSNNGSKFQKFLHKQGRDRSKSLNDYAQSGSNTATPPGSNSVASSSSSITSPIGESPMPAIRRSESRRTNKLKGVKELLEEKSFDEDDTADIADESMEETPVIVEPSSPYQSTRFSRTDRPISAYASDSHPGITYLPSSSSQRFSDLPTRLSGWFSHTFSTSTTDLSLPSILSQASLSASSPKSKALGGLLNAAKQGRERMSRYIHDSDATPDKCTDPIWLLGVQHSGYEPPLIPTTPTSAGSGRRNSTDLKRSTTSTFRTSASSRLSSSTSGIDSSDEILLSHSQSSSSNSHNSKSKDPGAFWPPAFYSDFTSRVWLTYRSHFPPIRDQSLAALDVEPGDMVVSSSPTPKRWNWPGGEKGWTSDSGWGCMLRTGQSLLANSLIHLHLGRDWRKPPQPVATADFATYVKILTWFLDSPDPRCPFSVHRMALAGKELGKDVGQWFGPSTAAGAIKTLVHSFPEAGLGVVVTNDGVLYETDVLAASNQYPYRFSRVSSPRRNQGLSAWGGRPVLVLVGIRLGIDGVNPVYYDSIKALFTVPQSVGISGGRPSSSYYFVGAQADNLFYLDPHHARATIPLRIPPRTQGSGSLSGPESLQSHNGGGSSIGERRSPFEYSSDKESINKRRPRPRHTASPTSLHKQISSSHSQSSWVSQAPQSPSPSPSTSSATDSPAWVHTSLTPNPNASVNTDHLDMMQEFYVSAYSSEELKTFHCEKVRKMPLNSLDPSMLIGFLCRDERDWKDLRVRMAEISAKHKTIFTIQDEPPSWPSDSDDLGLESVSDVDVEADLGFDEPADAFTLEDPPEDQQDAEVNEHNRSTSTGSAALSDAIRKSASEEGETEDEIVNPLTPSLGTSPSGNIYAQPPFNETIDEDADDDLEWVESGVPVMTPQPNTYTYQHDANQTNGKGKTSKSTPTKASSAAQGREFFPFPVVDDREDDAETDDLTRSSGYDHDGGRRQRTSTTHTSLSTVHGKERIEPAPQIPRIRQTRGRDGGRTQSGGVRGIITSDLEDGDDF